MSAFVIHALLVDGGILALCPLPGGTGHYAEDMAHLRDWRPAMVLSLTTAPEMVAEGVADLGSDIQELGTRWVHLPVSDFGVPDETVEAVWSATSPAALAALGGGGRVLIHCRGGCGRSGMAALRLMIEAGEPADEALRRLRAVRPCAVETQEQETWARGGTAARRRQRRKG